MKVVKLYVEGKNDAVFFSNYIEIVLGFSMNSRGQLEKNGVVLKFVVLKGWSKLRTAKIQGDLEEDIEDGITSLILVDADNEFNDGGFDIRKAEVKAVQDKLAFEFFLVPNNQDDGFLETILKIIIKEEQQSILKCLEERNACLAAVQNNTQRSLKLPPEKGAEKNNLQQFRNILNASKDYKDPSIWNFQHDYLIPLKNFLETHLLS